MDTHQSRGIFFPSPKVIGMAAQGHFSDNGIEIRYGNTSCDYAVKDIFVQAPVSGVNPVFKFADGALLECPASTAIHHWIENHNQTGRWRGISRLAHRVESRWTLAILLVVLAGLLATGVFRFGVPVFAQWAAYRIPESISRTAGKEIFSLLDQQMLKPSQLTRLRQSSLRKRFALAVAAHPPGTFSHPPKLHFRGGGSIGANALALPDGSIILTDELVQLAPGDAAIQGVLAHELGHVKYRHGMQMAITATAIPVLLSVVSGDLISSSQLVSTLPAVLLSSGYSREFEREADYHAKQVFGQLGQSTEPIAQFFEAIEKEAGKGSSDGVFSTHPGHGERIQYFKESP